MLCFPFERCARVAKRIALCFVIAICSSVAASHAADPPPSAAPKKIVLVAGKPSHPPRMHEFNAGVQLLARCLKDSGAPIEVSISLNGWPKDESILQSADAVVFYMDGGGGHEVVQEQGRRMALVDALAKRGVGIGCMHYAVEVVSDQAGKEFKRWIGGHYEHMCLPKLLWR